MKQLLLTLFGSTGLTENDLHIRFKFKGKKYRIGAFSLLWFILNIVNIAFWGSLAYGSIVATLLFLG